MSKKHTLESFIEKSRLLHGDKYDYSKVEYINNQTKVCIICPEHGEFWQGVNNHLNGHGCPKCALNSRVKLRTSNTDEFIAKANVIHNNLYNYNKVNYKNSRTKVCIICPEHGEFWQAPEKHLIGHGCPICRFIKSSSKCRMSIEEFINRALEIHKGKYVYSKVEYKNTNTKVCIICPKHGEFWQTPRDHLNGAGCPECSKRFGIAEKKVLEVFKEKYNNVIYQYRPKWLYNGINQQSIDIFLSDYDIAIEYQGRQHFYPNTKFGGEKEFEIIQERDKRKYQKCIDNNVKLFYISFERKVPDNYFSPVYRTTEELIEAIENYIINK